jgi:hypothetical protein
MSKAPKVSLRDEAQPSHEALTRVEEVEESGNLRRVVWVEETEEEFAERLADWQADPDRDTLERPEPGDMVEKVIEDRSGCDLAGLTTNDPEKPLQPCIDFLQQLLPGYVHGFSPSLPPDRPTPVRSRRVDKDGRPILTEAFIKCMQRRVRLGMSLQRPEDRPKQLPGRHDT